MMNADENTPEQPRKKRAYRGTVQAEVAALTEQRIIEAGLALFDEQWADQITLDQIAERAGVTVQTLLRRFGSKERLANAVSQEAFRRATQQRIEPPTGDLTTIVNGLVAYYEAGGERMLRGLAQEARHPQLHAIIDVARTSHREWLERAFRTYLERRNAAARARLLAQLFTLTGVYTWYQLRYESGLNQEETAHALYEMIEKLLF
ncbi:MAG: TetR/AcrR family transcriptional regulator [Ktedonobacteraceae bacterium]|nr:TetR/AcrR family transcriptional regulator [Ktedonobacteraceae bacterium]